MDLYIIINVNELDKVDFEQIKQTSRNTLRTSKDGSLTILKFDSENVPNFIENLETKSKIYSYYEIINILFQDEWLKEDNK